MNVDQVRKAARDAGAVDFEKNGFEHWSMPNTIGFLERFAREILRQAQQTPQYVEGRRQ